MFDEEPDGDTHGECAAEIGRLRKMIEEAKRLARDEAVMIYGENEVGAFANMADRLMYQLETVYQALSGDERIPE